MFDNNDETALFRFIKNKASIDNIHLLSKYNEEGKDLYKNTVLMKLLNELLKSHELL